MSLTEARMQVIEEHLRRSEARLKREPPTSARAQRHLKALSYWKDLTVEVRRLWSLVPPEYRDAHDYLAARRRDADEHTKTIYTLYGRQKK